jgi:hypothetical protein
MGKVGRFCAIDPCGQPAIVGLGAKICVVDPGITKILSVGTLCAARGIKSFCVRPAISPGPICNRNSGIPRAWLIAIGHIPRNRFHWLRNESRTSLRQYFCTCIAGIASHAANRHNTVAVSKPKVRTRNIDTRVEHQARHSQFQIVCINQQC